jgi:hypothetical protein
LSLLIQGSAPVAQERPIIPAALIKPMPEPAPGGSELTKLAPRQRPLYLSAKSGMEWLLRVNKPDGRFLPGFSAALRAPFENDNYLHQAGAALALARAAAYFHDDRATAVAKQALLTLLSETTTAKGARYTAAPEAFLNRLASAALLTLAIYELPNPAADLLQSADELTNYLHAHLQADGSFVIAGDDDVIKTEIIQNYTGPALCALMRSHAARPAPWKLDAVRKARSHYHTWWKQHKNTPMIAGHTAAYAEAYLATKEPAFADSVFEMNDWLIGLRYANLNARQAHWAGGFQTWVNGKASAAAPDIRSAAAAQSLVEACRVARAAGDAQRLERYRTALENCLHFVATLQYVEGNTQHFAEWYRQNVLLGGFHLSHTEGDLRIEYTHPAVAALVQHLKYVADLP